MPNQGNRPCLPARQATGYLVRVVFEAPSRLDDPLARLGADVRVRHIIQYQRDRRPRDASIIRDLALGNAGQGQVSLPFA